MSRKTGGETSPRLALLLALGACNLRPYDPHPGTGGSSDVTTSTGATRSTSAPGTSAAPTSTGTSTGGATTSISTSEVTTGLCPERPDLPGTIGCDHWTEDCCDGHKCAAYSGDGDQSWDGYKCVPLVADPDPVGHPCLAIGSAVSGEDSCDIHAMCWDVDPDTLLGTCLALCTGTPDAPDCEDPDAFCAIFGPPPLSLCFPQCDPLAQDCGPGETCRTRGSYNPILCYPDAVGEPRPAFDPCLDSFDCAPGLDCGPTEWALECDPMASQCCLPLCDLDLPNTCPGAGQTCVPWYDDLNQAASFNQDLGICRLP